MVTIPSDAQRILSSSPKVNHVESIEQLVDLDLRRSWQ